MKKMILIVFILAIPSMSLAQYMDKKKKAIKSCEAFNRIRHNVSKTRGVSNSGNVRLKVGYLYRVIEYRSDYQQFRIEIDYIPQGSVRHRWADINCFEK